MHDTLREERSAMSSVGCARCKAIEDAAEVADSGHGQGLYGVLALYFSRHDTVNDLHENHGRIENDCLTGKVMRKQTGHLRLPRPKDGVYNIYYS